MRDEKEERKKQARSMYIMTLLASFFHPSRIKHVHVYALMRDEKEGRKKQARSTCIHVH